VILLPNPEQDGISFAPAWLHIFVMQRGWSNLVLALEIAVLFPSCSDSESVSSSTFVLCLEAAAGTVEFAFLLLLDLDEDIVVNGDNFKK